ncbi:MAG: HAD family hydrolase [Lachnospiraceae bacterium]|nr:HAD family hydrolase [Lachnospiraceae bacterium]
MKYDSIILDVDGTLWDSTEVVAGVWIRAVRENGFPMWSITGDQLKQYFGKTMAVIAAEMLPGTSDMQRLSVMEDCCKYEHTALEEYDGDLTYPNVRETIIKLSEMLPVCIVSNCQAGYIELFMSKNEVDRYVTDTECFGNNGLGKADNIKLLVERNGFKNPVYVGDTDGDLSACEEAGVPFIYASYGFGTVEESRIAGKIDAFSELPDLL